jgi:acetyl-CoA C-acetyltransferase
MTRRIAIAGMGCSAAGDRFLRDQEELLVDAGMQALQDAGIEAGQVQAAWAFATGANQLTNFALKLGYTGQTGASGPDVLRCAYLAVASGTYDIVLAAAVEKLTDFGATDLNESAEGHGVADARGAGLEENLSQARTPAISALYLTRYQAVYGVAPEKLREGLSHIVARNHRAGARNANAGLRSPLSLAEIEQAQRSAGPMTVADCAGPSDGAAAAIVCSVEVAERLGGPYIVLEGLGMATAGNGARRSSGYDFTGFAETRDAAERAYRMAGITNPVEEIDHAELYDVTSGAELLAYEDLGLAQRGEALDYVLAGAFDEEGRTPTNTDGGLLCNGHQPGGSVLRQVYESYLQLTGRAGERQLPNVRRSVVQTLAGTVDSHSAFVQVFGRGQ